MDLSFPYEENLIQIEDLQGKLERKILSLEKDIFEVDLATRAIEEEIAKLKNRYKKYQNIYAYEYLLKLEASLAKVRDAYKYRKGPFNVIYYLMEQLDEFSNEFISLKMKSPGDKGGSGRKSVPGYPSGDPSVGEFIFHGADHRDEGISGPGKEIIFFHRDRSLPNDKISKFAALEIGGLNFLVPYNRFYALRLSSTVKIRDSRFFSMKSGDKTYKVIHLLRFWREFEGLGRAVNRPLVILIEWENIKFGLLFDRYLRRFYDYGGNIIKDSDIYPSSSLVSGKFKFRKMSYLVLDPKSILE